MPSSRVGLERVLVPSPRLLYSLLTAADDHCRKCQYGPKILPFFLNNIIRTPLTADNCGMRTIESVSGALSRKGNWVTRSGVVTQGAPLRGSLWSSVEGRGGLLSPCRPCETRKESRLCFTFTKGGRDNRGASDGGGGTVVVVQAAAAVVMVVVVDVDGWGDDDDGYESQTSFPGVVSSPVTSLHCFPPPLPFPSPVL
ncbi:hypothetical protein E2C01_002580 [Portunus trituberculatus]|uniref:Uncharacterized protein n=1 Tax=Portunus trituberculatus TaxID=210409 RepID=A0A5B7CKA7_PORTR|nr:hypothetical protein [Portunus trituberculatus]